MLRDFLIDDFVLGPTGLGSGVIDGVSLDDNWSDKPSVGSNACDGSPIGGPSEVESHCVEDMGLKQQDTTELTASFRQTISELQHKVSQAGGFTWPQFVRMSSPPQGQEQCVAFFRDVCSRGTFLNQPAFLRFTETPNRTFSPLPYLMQDLATFLLLRGDYAWIGYDWNSCSVNAEPAGGRHGQPYTFPSELDVDYGVPSERLCKESVDSPGRFLRLWTKAQVEFDCATWQGHITPLTYQRPDAAGIGGDELRTEFV